MSSIIVFSVKSFLVRFATAFKKKTTLGDCPKSTMNDFIVVLHDFFSPGYFLSEKLGVVLNKIK
jgi:hypothetical protein